MFFVGGIASLSTPTLAALALILDACSPSSTPAGVSPLGALKGTVLLAVAAGGATELWAGGVGSTEWLCDCLGSTGLCLAPS